MLSTMKAKLNKDKIRKLMKKNNIRQRDIYEKFGSRQLVWAAINRGSAVHAETFADIFNCKPQELIILE